MELFPLRSNIIVITWINACAVHDVMVSCRITAAADHYCHRSITQQLKASCTEQSCAGGVPVRAVFTLNITDRIQFLRSALL